MKLEERISALSKLSLILEDKFFSLYRDEIYQAIVKNPWFSDKNIRLSIRYWSKSLSSDLLRLWIGSYYLESNKNKKTVLIVMAGNIPLVGFHDMLCVLICGHKAVLKMSSQDNILIPLIIHELICIEPKFKPFIQFLDDMKGKDFDAVIATGSDSTAKYFDYYFRNKRRVIRSSRSSLAILDGSESKADLELLADDVFVYFGLGCRNVSHLFVPEGYDLDLLFQSFYKYKDLINHQKYMNNYDYCKTMLLMGSCQFLDNGFLLLQKEDKLFSPVSTLYYSTYSDYQEVMQYISANSNNLQCVISSQDIAFGRSQSPDLNEYADNIDVIRFLIDL